MTGLLVGFGRMGRIHASRYALQGIPLAVVEPGAEGQAAARTLGLRTLPAIPHRGTKEFDFVDICTPTYLHYDCIARSIPFGCPIFVEKPLIRTRNEAASLRKLRHVPPIFVGEVELFNPAFRPLFTDPWEIDRLEIVRDVYLSFFLRDQSAWFLDPTKTGGIVLDLMIHDLDLIVHRFGRAELIEARGDQRTFDQIDNVTASLSADGVPVTLTASWTGSNRTAPVRTEVRCHLRGGATHTLQCDDYGWDEPSAHDPFTEEVTAFLEVVRGGKPPFSLTRFLDAIDVAHEISQRAGIVTD